MDLNQAKKLEEYIEEKAPNVNGGLFCSVIMSTEVKMNKNKRGTRGKEAVPNPYDGRLKKISDIKGDCMVTKNNYQNIVNNRRKKEGLDPNFVAVKPTGKHHIEGFNSILQKDSDNNVHYQELFFLKKESRVNVHYELDGKPIAVDEASEFADFLPPAFFRPTEEGKSQGLPDGEEIVIRTPKVENIVHVKVGDFNFSK